jgi:hypothetical protein
MVDAGTLDDYPLVLAGFEELRGVLEHVIQEHGIHPADTGMLRHFPCSLYLGSVVKGAGSRD